MLLINQYKRKSSIRKIFRCKDDSRMADGMSGYTSFMGNKDDTLGHSIDSKGGTAFKDPQNVGSEIRKDQNEDSSKPGQEGVKDTGRNVYGY